MACKYHYFQNHLKFAVLQKFVNYESNPENFKKICKKTFHRFYKKNSRYNVLPCIMAMNIEFFISEALHTEKITDRLLLYDRLDAFLDFQSEITMNTYIFRCTCNNPSTTMFCEGDGTCLNYRNNDTTVEHSSCLPFSLPFSRRKKQTTICSVECHHKCQAIQCSNYTLCNKLIPAWLNEINNGICSECASSYGKIDHKPIIQECPICYEEKPNIKIFCGHRLCQTCWQTIVKRTKENRSPLCPLCRGQVFDVLSI